MDMLIGRSYIALARKMILKRFPSLIHSRIGSIFFYFPHCGFSNDSSMHSAQSMHSHTGCICLSFLHCVFSNVSLNCRRDMMHKHIGCIRLIFLCPLSLSLKPDWLCVISWFKIFNLQFLFPTESTLQCIGFGL